MIVFGNKKLHHSTEQTYVNSGSQNLNPIVTRYRGTGGGGGFEETAGSLPVPERDMVTMIGTIPAAMMTDTCSTSIHIR